jgi:Uma2 family endonuclease
VTFAGASHVPDVSIFVWGSIPRSQDGRVADRFQDPPDATAEIASPDQSVNALARKCRGYAADGVKIALLVDPDDESVLAFYLDERLVTWQGRTGSIWAPSFLGSS